MLVDFNILETALNNLEEDKKPQWGKLSAIGMLIHCNNFIEVALRIQHISFMTKVFGRIFGKLFLKYLESLAFDINKYPRSSKTLKEFKPIESEESLPLTI